MLLLFQARLSQRRDQFGLYWTDGQPGQYVHSIAAEGQLPSSKRYCWESTGRAAACELADGIERATELAKREGRQYRLVSIVSDAAKLGYLVKWVSPRETVT